MNLCLGIESTAHTFGISVVSFDGKVLSNCKDAYTTTSGGMIPHEVADHHVEVWKKVLDAALHKAQVSLSDIHLIAFSQGPGLGPSLRIGAVTARMIAAQFNLPIIGVNHCVAHLEIAKLRTAAKDPVMLYASGANTQVIALEGGKYRVFGETLDCGIGNFIDVFARDLGLGFPGGPHIETLAKEGKEFIELPYVVKGMDVSFGGILTNLRQKLKSGKYASADLAYSCQETVFAMLIEVSERAMAHCDKTELVLGGGVGCNKRLQEMCAIMCKERGGTFFVPENEFLVDNAAMIAWLGIIEHVSGVRMSLEETTIRPYERTDDVTVSWVK